MLALLLACVAPVEPAPPEPERAPWKTPPPSVLDAPERLVGFADVHGDMAATLAVLQLAGLTDAEGQWIGGETVAVQTGDQLDRGDDERAILELFEALSKQAWDAGGGFYPLLGNHETMNVAWDFRYVTDGGFEDFADVPVGELDVSALEAHQHGRGAAFAPGGPYATMLGGHNLVMQVGDTVFVHGGILPEHAQAGLDTINNEVRAWILGTSDEPDDWTDGDSPVWVRDYSDDDEEPACDELIQALEILGAKRMVVGHSVWDTANAACDGRVWRMDVGMAEHYGGTPAALEIRGDQVTLIVP
jgi:hypothetical protein